jgi:hypothetical protein
LTGNVEGLVRDNPRVEARAVFGAALKSPGSRYPGTIMVDEFRAVRSGSSVASSVSYTVSISTPVPLLLRRTRIRVCRVLGAPARGSPWATVRRRSVTER